MKNKRSDFRLAAILSVALFFLMTSSTFGQRDKSYILSNTNVEELQRMAVAFGEKYRQWREAAIDIALVRGWDTLDLMRLTPDGHPVYYQTNNYAASVMTNTTTLRTDLGVEGQGMVIGQWETRWPLTTHQDLTGRVTIMDTGGTTSSHATHVAGTLIGDPPIPQIPGYFTTGMAYQANLESYNSNNDMQEMAAAANDLLVSNHSYGTITGWDIDDGDDGWTWRGESSQFIANGYDRKFGQYSVTAEDVDQICWNAPFYLPVKSAGNDYNDTPAYPELVRNGTNGTYVLYFSTLHPPGDESDISTIPTWGNGKNIMTVGNLDDDEYINPSSSRGKTDDGRIKPDICGNGTTLYSADSGSNSDYSFKTGTSMSAPNVAGSLLLLQQAYEEQNGGTGQYMRSATLKGLAIHTATDKGWDGPDFTYGWGLLDASLAGDVIVADATNESGTHTSRILEKTFTTNMSSDSYYFNGYSSNLKKKITMCYTDLPGTGSNNHNESTPELVHDLDIRLYKVSTGELVQYPFASGTSYLDPVSGDNDVDNVEQIDTEYGDPLTEDLYELRVTVEGSLTQNQPYSLIISGENRECESNITHGTGAITSFIYRASNNITSQGDVNNGKRVHYQAANKVSLTPGFHAKPGSNFIANTKGCD